MINHKSLVPFFLCSAVSMSVFAGNSPVTVTGSITAYIPINQDIQTKRDLTASATPKTKAIRFERIQLSNEAQKYLADHIDAKKPNLLMASRSALPPQVSLGMNNTSVLDQGAHGACVTFAVSGALNAVTHRSNYVSQLCNLELGSYLAKRSWSYPSGWDGSTNEIVLNQIKEYGIVSMAYQTKYGCAGVYNYPLMEERNTGRPMSSDDFTRHSEQILKDISWKDILSDRDAFSDRSNDDANVHAVKQALTNNHRVVFGILVDASNQDNGAYGTFKARQDSWILTPEIIKHAKQNKINAGHAMIITGYDDNAEITGPNHTKHKGVFTLRNSWGTEAGDNGDYYMSYDYFKSLVTEIEEIVPTPAN